MSLLDLISKVNLSFVDLKLNESGCVYDGDIFNFASGEKLSLTLC